MSRVKVLVVDQNPATYRRLVPAFKLADYQLAWTRSGEEAIHWLSAHIINVLVINWTLPGISGLELLQMLKRYRPYQTVPIIFFCDILDKKSIVDALNKGAEDYITMPVSPRELIARINTILQRMEGRFDQIPICVGDLILDTEQYCLYVAGKRFDMTVSEFSLMNCFMKHPNKNLSRERLIELAGKQQLHLDERSIDVQIARLRRLLAQGGKGNLLQTVRGEGYRLSSTSIATKVG